MHIKSNSDKWQKLRNCLLILRNPLFRQPDSLSYVPTCRRAEHRFSKNELHSSSSLLNRYSPAKIQTIAIEEVNRITEKEKLVLRKATLAQKYNPCRDQQCSCLSFRRTTQGEIRIHYLSLIPTLNQRDLKEMRNTLFGTFECHVEIRTRHCHYRFFRHHKFIQFFQTTMRIIIEQIHIEQLLIVFILYDSDTD